MRVKPIIVVALVVAVLIIAAGGAYFLMAGGPPKIVQFIGQPESTLADGDALEAPRDGASPAARLPKGLQIDVVGIVEGGKWAEVTLPDKRTAYFAIANLATNPVDNTPPPPEPEVATVAFDPTSDVYTATKSVPVYVEPYTHAPQMYQIDAGTDVPAISRSKDGVWILAATENGDPAYLLVADLGPPRPGTSVAAPADDTASLPAAADGTAKVITTSSLEVGGQPVTLANINGEDGTYAADLQSFIDAQGGSLHCDLQPNQQYLCKLPSGIDIALAALYKGDARPTDDAPDNYQSQAAAAKSNHRGVWKQ